MTTPIPAEVIAEALAKHPYRRQDHCTIAYRSHCHCGWSQDVAGSRKSELELHAAHQAAVVAALPDIAIVPVPKSVCPCGTCQAIAADRERRAGEEQRR